MTYIHHMAQRNYLRILTAAFAAAVLFGACKKDDPGAPEPGTLVGDWVTTTFAADENANGQLDDAERQPTDSTDGFHLLFLAKNQGLMEQLDGSSSLSFRWDLFNNQSDLRMVLRNNSGDTAHWVVHIETLTATGLTILDTSDEHRYYWELRKR